MKSTIKKHLTILLLAGIGGSLHAQQAPPPDPYRTVLVAGTVEAVNAVKVESKLDGTSTIVWVVEEGAKRTLYLYPWEAHARSSLGCGCPTPA